MYEEKYLNKTKKNKDKCQFLSSFRTYFLVAIISVSIMIAILMFETLRILSLWPYKNRKQAR
ncbi:hypothetical protein BBG47_20100 [Paenibacillus sp. KS1]|nr:hypothetical protein BBG47_20100 [Paenibacillus sp. KS1]